MATNKCTFEEALGEECLRKVLIKVEETMQRVNSYTCKSQVHKMKRDIAYQANSLIEADEKKGETMAAAFCYAVPEYLTCCDKKGNVTVQIPNFETVYRDVSAADATMVEFPFEVYHEEEFFKRGVEDITPMHHEIFGLV